MASTASYSSSWTLAFSSDDTRAAQHPWISSSLIPTPTKAGMTAGVRNVRNSQKKRTSRVSGAEGRPSCPSQRSSNTSSSSSHSSSMSAGSSQPINTVYKTQQCKNWAASGKCDYDWRCQFAHGDTDVREPTRHDLYKTKRCRNFIKGAEGSCPFRDRCDYIHDELDENEEVSVCQEPAEVGQILQTLLRMCSSVDAVSSVDYFASRNGEGIDSRLQSPSLQDTEEQPWAVLQELEKALLGSRFSEGTALLEDCIFDLWNEKEEDIRPIPCPYPHKTPELVGCGMKEELDDTSSESGYGSLNSTPRRQSLSQDLSQCPSFSSIQEEIEAFWSHFYNPSASMDSFSDESLEKILAE